ncbi:MAG: UDP-N-acetylglucosamine pyrophosphorylase [Tetrasphaera sp.]
MSELHAALLAKGVTIRCPESVDLDGIDPDRISADGVVLHAGTRLRGASTVVSAGCELGREGPVTVEDCQLGPKVALKGGYAARSVFLAGASLGLGHHIREGTLLEEEASVAHCVGLKQTILLPFVTLGSLINFCDCLMAGGTSRKDHSEVGSSYIHFNFTPTGDKTTPSLFGDIPRGVMLRERPIFLGGQGGTVGPVQVAYGATVGAGSILRSDVIREDSLTIVGPPPSMTQDAASAEYRAINRIVAKNLAYVASLDALQEWHRQVRAPFFAASELGPLVAEGALAALDSARTERLSRLTALATKMDHRVDHQRAVAEQIDSVCRLFLSAAPAAPAQLLEATAAAAAAGTAYVSAIQGLDEDVVAAGTHWLTTIIEARWQQVEPLLPAVARLGRR